MAASLCNTLRHLDVSADTAVDFPKEDLFLAHVMSVRTHITQALHDNNFVTRVFKSYGWSGMHVTTPPKES